MQNYDDSISGTWDDDGEKAEITLYYSLDEADYTILGDNGYMWLKTGHWTIKADETDKTLFYGYGIISLYAEGGNFYWQNHEIIDETGESQKSIDYQNEGCYPQSSLDECSDLLLADIKSAVVDNIEGLELD